MECHARVSNVAQLELVSRCWKISARVAYPLTYGPYISISWLGSTSFRVYSKPTLSPKTLWLSGKLWDIWKVTTIWRIRPFCTEPWLPHDASMGRLYVYLLSCHKKKQPFMEVNISSTWIWTMGYGRKGISKLTHDGFARVGTNP